MKSDINHNSLSAGVDSVVLRELDPPAMSEVLRNELGRIEACIAEVRKQELDVDDRLAVVQREKDELVETRVALEQAVNLIRERLGRPASSVVVQLASSRPARQQPTSAVRQKSVRPGSKREQLLTLIKKLADENGGIAERKAIRRVAIENRIVDEVKNTDQILSGMLTTLKHAGFITNRSFGIWAPINIL